jgi:hypothetical protein
MKICLSVIATFFILIFSKCILFGQSFNYHRDFKKILKHSQKENSKLNYEKLLARFINLDTNLTPYEILALQIGFTNNKEYHPQAHLNIERFFINTVTDKVADTCIKYGANFLQRNPLNLAANYALYCAYNSKDSNQKAIYFKKRYLMLVKSILASGNGTNKPFFVLSSFEAQVLISTYLKGNVGDNKAFIRDKNGYLLEILQDNFAGKTVPVNFHLNHTLE